MKTEYFSEIQRYEQIKQNAINGIIQAEADESLDHELLELIVKQYENIIQGCNDQIAKLLEK